MPEVSECEKCNGHGERILALELESKWMQSALDEIRQHTQEVAECAKQLVTVAHETATMAEAVKRAFLEIAEERLERKAETKQLREHLDPIRLGWSGVNETSGWVKAGVLGLFALVVTIAIAAALHIK